ncbi:MAG: glycosyltransferase family 2 protein [Oscillospiraceae bacterium]|nr:glycosyltransferase family 2 protein [Oscillospiraceae bacterium]
MEALPKLYIVVPCYNEEEALPLTAPVFLRKLEQLREGQVAPDSRILFVDDGSADSTWNIIRELHEGSEKFSGLRLRRNRGHQNALTAGLMYAKDRCDITISIDADLQDDIDAMDAMVEKYKSGCGIVCGVRDKRETDTFLKRTTARGYYKMMKLLGSDLIYDHADYRLMDKAALEALSHYHGDDLFLRGLVNRLGARVGTVKYDRRAREAGESKYTLKKMMKLALKGMECGKLKPMALPRAADPFVAEVLDA